jgi:hypothetical protein
VSTRAQLPHRIEKRRKGALDRRISDIAKSIDARLETIEKLEAYLGVRGISSYAIANQTLQFIEDQGIVYDSYTNQGWEPEEPKPLPIELQIQEQVQEHMGWTDMQARTWYYTLNPLLGGLSPNNMVSQGRQDKLIKWINNQIDDDSSPKLPQKGAVKKLAAMSKARRRKKK